MNQPVIATDPDELVRRLVSPGEHLHLAGTPSRPNALTYTLCRVFGADARFTISTTAVHSAAHAIALSGIADKVIAGFAGDTYPSPRPNPLYQHLPEGRPFSFEAWSLLSYVQRLMAGAMGLPYAVTASLAGTDLVDGKNGELYEVADPAASNQTLTLLKPLRPDLTLVHGVCADEGGNIAIVPPLGEGAWSAYAARRGVIASVERIVPRSEMRDVIDRVVIPGERVLGLCEAPLGAHPQSLRTADLHGVAGYLDDYEFLERIVASCEGPERGADWYREWVTEPGSHAGYLNRLGTRRRQALVHRTGGDRDGAATARADDTEAPAGPPSRLERLIVLGARTVADQVRQGGYDTLLAGIGASHMAAWLAAALLRRGGHDVKVVAELGMYDFVPQSGDVFLFSLAHAERSQMLAGIPEILGGMVAANARALGVLAAAEIDETGAINTSLAPDGSWLTGSGGANDIASTTDCVVIAASSRRRYVPRVHYRTSPGWRVREVVSDFGRFRRDSTGFRLDTWLPEPSECDSPADLVARRTAWQAPVAGSVTEKPITAEELELLRTLDPDGRYR